MTRAHIDIDVRPITQAEHREWLRAVKTGFLQDPVISEEEFEARRERFDVCRYLGAFEGDRCVATFRSFDQEVTAVGGAPVAADAVSSVTVTATHRRRGLLTRMMNQDLAAAKERGDTVATLIAAEYPIYGRYGFGPATSAAEWTVDIPRAGLDPRWSGPDDGGRIDIVDAEDVRKFGPELHDRVRRLIPGVVDRDDWWWRMNTGAVRIDPKWKEPFYALYRAADGEVQGLVAYEVDDKWGDAKQPQDTATVRDLLAATPAAERALWSYLCSIDWVTRIKSGQRAPDDLLPLLLPDARAAQLTSTADWLWVRILDVVRALESRTYEGTGSLVLEIADRAGLAGGRFRLEASAQGASCTPTTESAELTLDTGDLARLWLGDESVARLVALGRVQEERAGAARSADALLRTSRRPWCPDMF
ncbi:GNAT family N-acetyltransferase [Streptomyces spinosirectus]|jgi:predicted acetyltransferase|uniref:GNAT family N-acetyltransferase n=1 Tax=Streptomyces TaxID=1883 RepID=UPI000D342F65|nr:MULTISPECIES: GNAT family N-acetyltransferase [Streptomyces]MBY8340038.1 GNAT family N-acetyltransferase [Streptomyces plumbidurans]PTM98274.1 putative acetyltransferase [Streptomyces sp. VMFN-G11Ma]UIR19580.1 GNAT family N-acetyltransferase [Streptomyces spinosirectus]